MINHDPQDDPAAAAASPAPAPAVTKKFVAGAAALLLAAGAAGAGISHAVWPSGFSAPVSSSRSNQGVAPGTGLPGRHRFGIGGNGFGDGNGSAGPDSASGSNGTSADASTAAKVDPALVDINTVIDGGQGEAAGTGIVMSASGEVLTNNHVIEGATQITATDVGNGKTYTAKVAGYDRSHDIAVIQLQNASGLTVAALADSSKVSVGQSVVGVGNAGGRGGTPSYAGGSVTATDRSITASDAGAGTSEHLTGLIATNADIQAGDSGGPLVDSSGSVVGMDTAASADGNFAFSGGGSSGYAIPINTVESIAKEIEGGTASSSVHLGATAFIGVEIAQDQQAAAGGVVIAGTVSGGPAAGAGLRGGDAITALNGSSVSTGTELSEALTPFHPGDQVALSWTDSSGASHSATITLASGPAG